MVVLRTTVEIGEYKGDEIKSRLKFERYPNGSVAVSVDDELVELVKYEDWESAVEALRPVEFINEDAPKEPQDPAPH